MYSLVQFQMLRRQRVEELMLCQVSSCFVDEAWYLSRKKMPVKILKVNDVSICQLVQAKPLSDFRGLALPAP